MGYYKKPIYIDKYNIYDIFYNDNNQLILITPYTPNPYIIKYISDENIIQFDLYEDPDKHTIIYSLNIVNYNKNIKLIIDDSIIETIVNKYPIFNNEIIFSTIVKDEDAFILSWIDYHLRLGVSRFIIYDNSTNFTLSIILNDYIKQNIVLLIKWDYPYRRKESGISGQTTQQNHSIYAFKNSKYIGLFDIDEYVNIQQGVSNIHQFFKNLIIKENIDVNKISSFRLLNKFFYNPHNIPIKNNNFLSIYNCDNITKVCREKNFVIAKNVITFAVHQVTSGKPMYNVNEKHAYFNHYFYLNKNNRGKTVTDLIDDSILKHL